MASPLSFAEFQDFIRQHYHPRDSARGTPATFMWLMEEVGELASALQKDASHPNPQALADEFADVLGWLATLANMHGVDLEEALRRKYMDRSDPAIHKS
ncbi:MAG: nucleotide pyrophosphohydrolase [Burkholderiales bacterium]|jgi:NTP pyrophosphatase (non-canonical NTP hydrolase)|nr:nucleotide pyrophosphohydrolase [Burkholderiales bacterium]